MFYGIIAIHNIPYEIAVKRNHPHQDVLHVAGWVSLFTLHVLWPFLWILAMLYREDRGRGMDTPGNGGADGKSLGEHSATFVGSCDATAIRLRVRSQHSCPLLWRSVAMLYAVAGFFTLKSTPYSTGTTPSVNTVPNARPFAMINASE